MITNNVFVKCESGIFLEWKVELSSQCNVLNHLFCDSDFFFFFYNLKEPLSQFDTNISPHLLAIIIIITLFQVDEIKIQNVIQVTYTR